MNPGRPVKTLLIDDEMSANLLLEELLAKIEGVQVMASSQNIDEGVKLILQHRPDIVFLDIKLHDENGFDLIRRLKDYDLDPFIVMVTGYDQFAMDAIKAGAFDYLLKPVDPGELLKVISRFRQKQAKQHQPEPVKKIRFNTLGGFILIDPEEILYCQAEANYTDIFLTSQHKQTISLNIGSIEKVLTHSRFFRISRSAIINLKYVTGINRGKKLVTLSHQNDSCHLHITYDKIRLIEGELV